MTRYGLMTGPLGDMVLRAEDGYLSGVFFVGQKYFPETVQAPFDPAQDTDSPVLRQACRQLEAYLSGQRHQFDLPLRLQGSEFQQRVWRQLLTVPFGITTTYGAIAMRLGLGGAHARAVGAAVGRNPLTIVVPCHRVVGCGGGLCGYAGGLDRKRRLLELERSSRVVPEALSS